MPLNLKDAGINDNLARMEQIVDTAMEDGAMLYNPVEPDRSAVAEIIRRVYESKAVPLHVDEQELGSAQTRAEETACGV